MTKTTTSQSTSGDSQHSNASIRCTLLAAGLGRRLEPLTVNYIPKPMFPLGGQVPILETWVRKMTASGITDISMNLCVLKETIKNHFGDGGQFGAKISYVEEDVPSGTMGGVCRQALGRDAKLNPNEKLIDSTRFHGSTIIAPSGDIVTNFSPELLEELYDIHKKVGAAFTMVLVPVPLDRRKDFGTAWLESPENRAGPLSRSGQITQFYEKDPNSPTTLNNASIYLIEMRLIEELDRLRTEASLEVANPFYDFGKHVFPALLGKLPYIQLASDNLLWGVEYTGEWIDVGQKRDYLAVNRQVLDGGLHVELPYQKQPWGYLGPDTAIDLDKVQIVPPVVIGSRCTIEPGATLGPYAVVGDDWTIRKNAQVSHSVLWPRYDMYRADGSRIPASDVQSFDRHVVGAGVKVEHSILAGGEIMTDVVESTVVLSEHGELSISPLDAQPQQPRV